MIKHPVLERKPALCQYQEKTWVYSLPQCPEVPQVWFKGLWICMDHAEQEGLGQ